MHARAFAPLPAGYLPRAGEASVLHRAVRDNLESFLADTKAAHEHGFGVPRFVEEEFRSFLRCGVVAHGFVRARCASCGHGLLVGFSCKRRAVCPSCTGRRAAECAAHLVDNVLPRVPVRQWVLTFPRHVRFALARDKRLAARVIGIWLRALGTLHRRRARERGTLVARTAAVTFVQRFGTALDLNVHLHTVLPDGVFEVQDDDNPTFVSLPPPSDAELDTLLLRVVTRVRRALEKANLLEDPGAADTLDHLRAQAVAGKPGPPVERHRGRHEAFFEGYSLHAGVHLHENDRQGIERLCRYGARGPLTLGRLTRASDDTYVYKMKRTIRGKDELILTGKELTRKLAVLVPPPRVHLVRFHGLFAPNAKLRAKVVPGGKKPARACKESATSQSDPPLAAASDGKAKSPRDGTSRIDWASLLKRIFKFDVLACGKCGGRMKVLAVIEDPPVIEKLLSHMGLPHVPLPTSPARGQRVFDFFAA